MTNKKQNNLLIDRKELIDCDKYLNLDMNEIADDFLENLKNQIIKDQEFELKEKEINLQQHYIYFEFHFSFLTIDDILISYKELERKDINLGSVFIHPIKNDRVRICLYLHFN